MQRTLAVALLLVLAACGGDDDAPGGIDAAASGRACVSGLETGDQTALVSPSLDCPSRVCLHVQDEPADLCTDDCEDASDCLTGDASSCEGDFVCAAPVDQGPFACRKVCVCASAVPSGGFPVSCAAGEDQALAPGAGFDPW